MTVSVAIDLERLFAVKEKADVVYAVLADVPTSVSHFPDVERLVDLGNNVYRWEMTRIGRGSMSLQTVYASRYISNKKKRIVDWSAVEGIGNATIAGSWSITPRGRSTHIILNIRGQVHVPVMRLMSAVVVPIVRAEFDRQIAQYIANLTQTFGGSAL